MKVGTKLEMPFLHTTEPTSVVQLEKVIPELSVTMDITRVPPVA